MEFYCLDYTVVFHVLFNQVLEKTIINGQTDTKMEKIYTNFKVLESHEYNKLFNPNICHVCKLRTIDDLISCDRCHMISYCSKEHKEMHLQEHSYICTHIERRLTEIPEWRMRQFPSSEWLKSKKEFMQSVQALMTRELQPYEMQMLMCAKSCLTCHKQVDLFTCEVCYSSNFCLEHLQSFTIDHSTDCENLTLLLNLDLANLQKHVKPLHNYNIADLCVNYNDILDTPDMASFAAKYLAHNNISGQISRPALLNLYVYTEYISGPLTLCYGISQTLSSYFAVEDFCIHVIAANCIDEEGLPTWEFLLHLLRDIKNLTVVLVGPELQSKAHDVDLCHRCKIYGQNFSYKCYPMLYHDYVSSTDYILPSIVTGFQADFEEETWTESIKALHQCCPLLLTALSECKMQKNITRIKEVLGVSVTPALQIENNYRSLRPYKDFNTDVLFYRNMVLVVYNDLIDKNEADT